MSFVMKSERCVNVNPGFQLFRCGVAETEKL